MSTRRKATCRASGKYLEAQIQHYFDFQIRISAAPLLAAGFIDTQYVESAIRVVEEYGDYIVVGDGVALAHANQSAGGVSRDCLSRPLTQALSI